MVGRPAFGPGVAEEGNVVFRRSLYVVEDMGAGDRFTPANLRAIRPGFGVSPRFLDMALGHRAARAIKRGTPLSWNLVGEA
jgi:N-acetylneuraminate synthase